MGNNLCRERIARADNSKSPIDRIIGRCAQVWVEFKNKSINYTFLVIINLLILYRSVQQMKQNRIIGKSTCKLILLF